MRRPFYSLLALSLLASACQTSFGAPDAPTRIKKPSTASTSAPSSGPSAAPLAGNLASPRVSPTPGVPMTTLKGLLKMDASYVVSAGGGNVVSAGGGNVISAGGGNVVSAGGGNLIKIGGQVISAGGANVVSAGGANVVSAGGGNVVSAGGANYRLQATEPAVGDMLPAAGMIVVAVSLRTGKPVSEAVLTDGEGRYQLGIPKTNAGGVRVIAAVPGKSETDPVLDDPTLRSELIATRKETESTAAVNQVIDDDSTVVAFYFRQAITNRLDELLLKTMADKQNDNPLIATAQAEFDQAALEAKTASMPLAERRALAGRMAESMIDEVDFESAEVRDVTGWRNTTGEKSFPAFKDIVRQMREAAVKKLRVQRDYFDTAPYIVAANAGATPPKYVVRRASDLGQFCVERYLSQSNQLSGVRPVLADIGMPADQEFRLEGADWGISTQLTYAMVLQPELRKKLVQLIKDSAKR